MNLSSPNGQRTIVFVAPHAAGECLRSAHAVAQLDGVRLLGICEQTPEPSESHVFREVLRVDDVHDATQLVDAVRTFAARYAAINGLVTVHETLLAPVATAREVLGLPGMRADTVHTTLDKSRLKQCLQQAGIETVRDQIITNGDQARQFISEVGYPIVLKPLGGSGGLATWRICDAEQLDHALDLLQPTPTNAIFAQDHLQGQELCIDTITVANEPRFFSICRYQPTILDALEDPDIQWTCLMPREITSGNYGEFIAQGLAAVRALRVGDAMTHLEGFQLEGGRVRFTDATLRPAGARIAPMLAFAYDIDPYRAWARVAVDGCFDGPWERKFAVGTIFLRGRGVGRVQGVRGIQAVREQLAERLVDCRPPRVGSPKAVTYTGDGYITVRHPETKEVEDALELISKTVVVTYDDASAENVRPGLRERWTQRLRHVDQRLSKPAWDHDVLPEAREM